MHDLHLLHSVTTKHTTPLFGYKPVSGFFWYTPLSVVGFAKQRIAITFLAPCT